MINVNDLRQNALFETEGSVFQVLEFRRHKNARARGIVNIKARDIKSSGIREFTFKSNDNVQNADVESRSFDFVYYDQRKGIVILTDPETKKRFNVLDTAIDKELLGFMKEGLSVLTLCESDDKGGYNIYSITLPNTVELKVTQAPPNERGDTSQGGSKPVTVETGMTIHTPFFIKEGDVIKVNTVSKEYIERVNK